MVLQRHSLAVSLSFSPSWGGPALAIPYLLEKLGQEGLRRCFLLSQRQPELGRNVLNLHHMPTIQQPQSHPHLPSSSPRASQSPSDSSANTIPAWQMVQISQRVAGKMDPATRRNVAMGNEQLYPCFPPFGTETSSPAHFSLCFGSVNPTVRS